MWKGEKTTAIKSNDFMELQREDELNINFTFRMITFQDYKISKNKTNFVSQTLRTFSFYGGTTPYTHTAIHYSPTSEFYLYNTYIHTLIRNIAHIHAYTQYRDRLSDPICLRVHIVHAIEILYYYLYISRWH
jgi:hypothetical protein